MVSDLGVQAKAAVSPRFTGNSSTAAQPGTTRRAPTLCVRRRRFLEMTES